MIEKGPRSRVEFLLKSYRNQTRQIEVANELPNRLKQDMWNKVSQEMGIPWRTAEAMHWQLGEQDIQRRAGVAQPFVMSPVTADEPHGSTRASTRHAHSHSHSQSVLSRTVTPGSGYERGESSTSSRPLASRRESIPRHVSVYPEHVPESYTYHQHHSMPLAPIKTESQSPLPGILPGVAELTTGVSPYNTMAYSIPSQSPGPNNTVSPWATHMNYPPPPEPTGSKRRRSPDTNHHLSPDLRRRHLDPRP